MEREHDRLCCTLSFVAPKVHFQFFNNKILSNISPNRRLFLFRLLVQTFPQMKKIDYVHRPNIGERNGCAANDGRSEFHPEIVAVALAVGDIA